MKIFHYTDAVSKVLYFNHKTNTILFSGGYWSYGKSSQGRMACVDALNADSPNFITRWKTRYTSKPKEGDTLYVSSGSKIPRDLLRNSGYKITRDKDKADYVVIPEAETQSSYKGYICALRDGGCFEWYDLRDNHTSDNIRPTGLQLDIIERRLKEQFSPIEVYKSVEGIKLTFTKDITEHEELFTGRAAKYVLDTQVALVPSTTINPENLDIIARMPEFNAKMKILMSSDFQKYPYTMCKFFENTLALDYGYKYGDQVNWMMKAVHYDQYDGRGCYPQLVEPEDYNMLQDWIFYQLGVSGNAGLISPGKVGDLRTGYRESILRKTAVKKLKIDQPMSEESLKSLINNSM